MEKTASTHRRGLHHSASPSFSSSLLEAIYRSIDDDNETCRPTKEREIQRPRKEPYLQLQSTTTTKKQSTATAMSRDYNQCNIQTILPQKRLLNLTSTSSESSFGEFSSSDAESLVAPVWRKPHRLRPPPPAAPAKPEQKKPKQESSFSRRFRRTKSGNGSGGTTLKKAKTKTPSSPARRLARIFNTLCSTAGQQKKPNHASTTSTAMNSTSPPPAIAIGVLDRRPTCSRSCLRKNPSAHVKSALAGEHRRSVRFSFIDYSEDGYRNEDTSGVSPVSMVMASNNTIPCCETGKRGFGFEDEEDDEGFDGDLSDTSSDLFELEGLTMVGGGGGRWNGDLPVYETTHVATNFAIARGLVC